MCGIVAGAGQGNLLPYLLHGLEILEYRGYDSAGVSLATPDGVRTVKTAGHVRDLRALVERQPEYCGPVGIAHTRWATHGAPCTENAHPHSSMHGLYTVVHNGIIENYRTLRETLTRQGYAPRSETDTETFADLLESLDTGDALRTLRLACEKVRGSYAFCVLYSRDPDAVYCAADGSPLLVGRTDDGTFAASDRLALPSACTVFSLQSGEFARLTARALQLTDAHGEPLRKTAQPSSGAGEAVDKAGYDTFMEKEIFEQPQSLARTLQTQISLPPTLPRRVYLVGCGSAYHAAVSAAYLWEDALGVPCIPMLASEFRYRAVAADAQCLVVPISQSGETADTLAALRMAKAAGIPTLSVINTPGSTMDTESERTLYTCAGREIAVATTKAYTAQLAVLAMCVRQHRPDFVPQDAVRRLPEQVRQCLGCAGDARRIAEQYSDRSSAYFIGRLFDYPAAMEGALKLRETAYVDAHAYAAGELKHGTISLVRPGTLCVAVCTAQKTAEKTVSNIEELRARGAKVLCVTTQTLRGRVPADDFLIVPDAIPAFLPILSAVSMQLFAFFCAKSRKCAIDQPRNLAKSVTVE